ncbi:MAG: BF3164 family lipoprotein [Dysgonamonadaceae bacterium]|nr:BF3164 family lipoprotein [Dysgonamonadaceae bacterium]MDD4727522.1 BF3164 family lipoprotein [Dysgonamonadaceae bacterium]
MKQHLLLLSLLLFFISCIDNASSDGTFPETKTIKHTKVFSNNEPIFRGGDMLYFERDNSLIIVIYNDDYNLLKVNLNDNSITKLLPVGNGPDEFVNIDISQKTSDSTFLFQDSNSAQLYEMNIITGEMKKEYDYAGRGYMKIVKMNDYYIGTGVFNEGMFAVTNNNDSVRYVHHYPEDNIDNSKTASKAMAYQGKLFSNNSRERVMFCSIRFPYFEIFQFNQYKVSSVKKSYIGEFEYTISPYENMTFAAVAKNNREGYVDACTTSENIYLLYSGRSVADADIETNEQASLSNQILVYDWDGNLVMQYETDVDLTSICVNESETIIYGVSFNPDPEIVIFKL